MTHDALIIGGGPAGATVALLLAKGGWSVAVTEKAAFPRRKVCGEFISATTLPVLHEIGVGEAFSNLAGPEVRRVGLFANDTTLAAPLPQLTGLSDGWGRALGREHLDLLLLNAAAHAGARIWQPWSAIELRRSEAGYVCNIASKGGRTKELFARIVIVAHGSWGHSLLPWLKPKAHEHSDLLAFKAHFRDCDLPTNLMPLLVFPGGYGGMAQDGKVRRGWSFTNAHGAKPPGEDFAIDRVAIADDVPRRPFPTAGFGELPGNPFGIRVCRHTQT
jgi:flavin-dependent dehydrogenase